MVSSFIFRAAGFNEIIELLKETNQSLKNVERLLEFTLSPPDLSKYKKGMGLDDIPRMKLSEAGNPSDQV
jgi:hypothetical protein